MDVNEYVSSLCSDPNLVPRQELQREVTLTENSQVIVLLSCGHWHEFWAATAAKEFDKSRRPGCLRCRPANHDATVQGIFTRDRGVSRIWIEES